MTARDDLDRQLDAFLVDGPTELPGQSYYAVRDRTESTRQRAAIGPWRTPDMNRFVTIGIGVAAVIVALVVGTQLLGPTAPAGVGGAPPASPSQPPVGGTVEFEFDGAPATTEVDTVADGAVLSGTAVTTLDTGTHTVRLECAARDGDTWVLGGTVEQTTVPGETPGFWSAVVVREGSPQQIAIPLSLDKSGGEDCARWLAGVDRDYIPAENFVPVTSGALLPPPDLAP